VIHLFENLRNKELPSEERDAEKSKQIKCLLKTTNITKEFKKGINLPVVNYVPWIISDI